MKTKRNKSISKKIMVLMLSIFLVTVSIHHGFASNVYADSMDIQGVFSETLSADKSSTVVDLRIEEPIDKTIESITLPDQRKIVKEEFKRDERNQFLFEYTAIENKKLEFVVEYTEQEVSEQTFIQDEVKKETLTYEVKDIIVSNESTLKIDAKDITYKIGEEMDLKKDILITDENDTNITSQLDFNIFNYGGFTKDVVGSYELMYAVNHPISKKEYVFSRKVNIAPAKEKDTLNSKAVLAANGEFNLSLTGWKETAETFNITVSTAMAKKSTGNVIRIKLPQYVKLVTTPSSNVDVEKIEVNGDSEQPSGTDIYVYIKDSATLNNVYDGGLTISVSQKDYLTYKGVYDGIYAIEYLYTNDQGINVSTRQEFTFKNNLVMQTPEITLMQNFGEDNVTATLPISFNADMSLVNADEIGSLEMILPEGITWIGDEAYFTPSQRKLSIPIKKNMINEANGSILNGLANIPLLFKLEFNDVDSKTLTPQFKSDKVSSARIKNITFKKEKIRYTMEQTSERVIKSIDEVTNTNGIVKTPKVLMYLGDQLKTGNNESLSNIIATSNFDKSIISDDIKVVFELGVDYIWYGKESITVNGVALHYDKDSHTVEANVPPNILIDFQTKNKIAILENLDLPLYMDKDKLEKDLLDSRSASNNGSKTQAITVKSIEMIYGTMAIVSDSTTLIKKLSYTTTIHEPVVNVSFSYAKALYFGTKNSELFKYNISTVTNMSTVDSIEIHSQKVPDKLHITRVELPTDLKFLNGTKLLYTTNKTSSVREYIFDENIKTFQTNGEYIISYQIILPEISKDYKGTSVEMKFFGDVSLDDVSIDKVEEVMSLSMPEDSFGRFQKQDYIAINKSAKEADITLNFEFLKGEVTAELVSNYFFKQGESYDNIFSLNLNVDKNDTQVVKGITLKKDKNLRDGFEINRVAIHPDVITSTKDVVFKYTTNKKSNQEFIPSSSNLILNLANGEFLYDYTIEIGEVNNAIPNLKEAIIFGGKVGKEDLSGKDLDIVYSDGTTARMTMKIAIGNIKRSALTLPNLTLYREDSVLVDTIKAHDSLSNYYIEGESITAISRINTIGTMFSSPINLTFDINLPSTLKATSIRLANLKQIKYKEMYLVFKTNLNAEERSEKIVNNRFMLPEGEYFTSASIVMKETTHSGTFKEGYFDLNIGITKDKYDHNNHLIDKVTEDTFGVTVKNHDKTTVQANGVIRYYRDTKAYVNLEVKNYKMLGDKTQFYPEDSITVAQSAILQIRNSNKNPLTDRQRTIESPIYYIPIGNDFDYVEDSLVITNFIDKKPLTKVVSEGENKYLKIEFYGDELSMTGLKAQDVLQVDFQFDVKVSRFANEAKNLMVMSSLGVSLDKTLEHLNSGETTDESYVSSTSPYRKELVVKGVNVLFPTSSNAGNVHGGVYAEILQYAGISSIHAVKLDSGQEYNDDVDLLSNDTINYQFSVANRVGNTVKSYYAYIPIPEKGVEIEYIDQGMQKKFVQEWDALLSTSPTFTSSNNAKVSIDYSSSAKASTAGQDDPSNEYSKNVKLEDVRMIRVKVSDMNPNFAMNIKISFKVKSDKEVIGKLQNIMNVKYLYNYGDWNSSEKFVGQLKFQKWNLEDYEVSGFVWEDSNKDGVFKNEQKIAGVELEIKENDTDKTVANLITGADGSYHYTLPNLNKNYNIYIDTKKDWYLTKKGDSALSSHFDSDSKIAKITNQNYKNINAGLISLAKIEVMPNPIQVKEGAISDLIEIKLSNVNDDEKVSLNISVENENIAFYDKNSKVVQGVKEGNTNLIVSLTTAIDGKVIKEKVTITVSKDNVPTAQFDDITMFANSQLKVDEGIIIKDGNNKELDLTDTSIIQIDASNVKVNEPGKYFITYTVELNGVKTEFKRNVYVHGNVQLVIPIDRTGNKVGDKVDALEGATATYQHINEDGTKTVKHVMVTTLNKEITSNIPAKIDVLIEATVTVHGAISAATGTYSVAFNEKAMIDTVHDNRTVKVGASLDEIKQTIQASASMNTPDGSTDLTNFIDWSFLNDFNTNTPGNTITGKIFVLDPDTREKVEKEIAITISQDVIINATKEIDLVVGDVFDPYANVTIIDGDSKNVTLTDDNIISNNVEADTNGKTTKQGVYTVTYQYTDKYGNKKQAETIVHVHGRLQFEGLQRIDLIEKESTYVVNTAKAFYINSKDKKVYVDGSYNKDKLDQSVVGKYELTYSSKHPINNEKEISTEQNVFIHGDIVFHKPTNIPIGKVNTTLDPKMGITATFDYVNEDGTITTKDVPVTSKTVIGKEVGYVDGKINAKVQINELVHSKDDTAKVAFNGVPYIDSVNIIQYNGMIPSSRDIIDKISASAGMKRANGVVIDLTSQIDYSDVSRVILDKSGNYKITLTVTDSDGFTTSKTVDVIVIIKDSTESVAPIPPITPPDSDKPNSSTPELSKEKDTVAVVSKDIPLSEIKKSKITDDFIKSYISVYTETNGVENFKILSHDVLSKIGEYEATIELEDGAVLTVKLKVVDDILEDVVHPEYGRDKDCIIQWIIFLLFMGYSIYSIITIVRCRKDNRELERALEGI